MKHLTQDRLKELLSYDAETGYFVRILTTNMKNVKVGDIAGSYDKDGYLRIKIDGGTYKSHRLAWLYVYGKWPEDQIDHINHIKDDNCIENLREATGIENARNKKLPVNNTSKVAGVDFHKRENRWRVRISVSGERVFSGQFADWFEAVCARKSAENKYGFHRNHGAAL